MTARLDVVALRAGWQNIGTGWEQVDWAFANVPVLLDHIDVLHQAIRRAASDPQIGNPGAYLQTLLDEVTG
jgi:hypothetical protein